ncbi:MAG: hypothetical protein RLZ98_2840 [Pseudomonadota bacterium]|jgi:gamma-glutamylcyclotransferase (GGCT)/AIG2-like uncharacterized protein YtfP
MPHYFAYGSNMSPHQMQSRCPGARPVCRARLEGWRFLITKRGTANIRPSAGAVVHGALWRIEPRHIAELDLWEGVKRRNFLRRSALVTVEGGRLLSAFVYVSHRDRPGVARTSYMMTAVIPGGLHFGLPPEALDELQSWLPPRPIGDRRVRYVGRRG